MDVCNRSRSFIQVWRSKLHPLAIVRLPNTSFLFYLYVIPGEFKHVVEKIECFHWTETCLNFSFLSTCYRYMYFRSKYRFSNTIYINRMFDYSGTFHWSICPRICPFFPAIKTQDNSAGYRFIDRLGTYCCLDIISWQYPAKIHSVSTRSVSIPHGFSSSSVPPNKPTSQKNQTCVKCLPF